jgi:REP element-mobilizing transposase RayT
MASPSPLLYNTYYHIYNRGVNRENVFKEERNYDLFLRLYEKHLAPVTDLFAYCLLKNHFHLSLRVKSEDEIKETLKVSHSTTLQADQAYTSTLDSGKPGRPLGSNGLGSRYVSDKFSNFFNAYAKTMNKTYGRTGSLFQHPFGRVQITADRQFWNVIAYIHQNPQKHGFVKDFRDWKYSSYGVLLEGKPTPIHRSEVMRWFGTRDDYLSLHEQWINDARAKWFTGDDD